METKKCKWMGTSSDSSLTSSNSLSLPQSFHRNLWWRPGAADGRQDESPINHPTKDNKSWGDEFNQTKQESESRRLQEVRGAQGSSGTPTDISTPSACVPVHRQNPGNANQSGNGEVRPPCCDSPVRSLERAQRGKQEGTNISILTASSLDWMKPTLQRYQSFSSDCGFSLSVFLPFAFFSTCFQFTLVASLTVTSFW